jgi:transcriptional regulator
MYVPSSFVEQRLEVLYDFITKHAFATLVSGGGGGGGGADRAGATMTASHLPMLLSPSAVGGQFGRLQTHLARQNEQCQSLAACAPVLAIFQGPHAYISPRWYQNPVSVPTWNYVVVHARGTPRAMEDDALRAHLHALVAKYEPPPGDGGWDARRALPDEVMDKLQQQVIGFEIEITRLEGKWKLGQNRTPADRQGAIAGLRQSGEAEPRVLAEWMAATLRT